MSFVANAKNAATNISDRYHSFVVFVVSAPSSQEARAHKGVHIYLSSVGETVELQSAKRGASAHVTSLWFRILK